MLQEIWKIGTSAYIAKEFYRIPYSLLVDIGELLKMSDDVVPRSTPFSHLHLLKVLTRCFFLAESAKFTIASVFRNGLRNDS